FRRRRSGHRLFRQGRQSAGPAQGVAASRARRGGRSHSDRSVHAQPDRRRSRARYARGGDDLGLDRGERPSRLLRLHQAPGLCGASRGSEGDTAMTAHDWMVLATGLVFLSAGAVLSQVFCLLGPTYHTKITAHWAVRGFFFASTLILVARGLSFVFPGRAFALQHMSGLVPARGCVVLGLALVVRGWVVRERAPPPWTERGLGVAVRRGGSDQGVAEMAFALPPEPRGGSASEREPCRCVRLC